MTDRELLELAARAAGHDTSHKWNAERLSFDPPVIALCIPGVSTGWNPLQDDGDALRLAVKLRLSIIQEEEFVLGEYLQTVEVMSEEREDGSRICIMQSFDDDPMTATRRAIVRAAAEIGRAMP